jgi:hypothetical protein
MFPSDERSAVIIVRISTIISKELFGISENGIFNHGSVAKADVLCKVMETWI